MIEAPNHTQVPNRIFELLPELSEAETKVIMVITRQTIGWQKKRDRISLTQLQKKTGMSRSSVNSAAKNLKKKDLILINETKKGNEFELHITESKTLFKENEGSTESEPLEGEIVQNSNRSSAKSEPSGSTKSEHTKETITKETKQKSARENICKILKAFGTPEFAKPLFRVKGFKEAYVDYLEYIKLSWGRWPNEVSVKMDYKKLLELQSDGNGPVDVIHQTIHAKAKSFFAVRDFDSKKPNKNDWDQQHLKRPEYQEV